jgi:alpha-L-rhamnosidase
MKKYTIALLIILLPFCTRFPGNKAPSGLMVEFIRKPENVKIMDPKPEFTWVVPLSAKRQTAYQILVASSRDKLEKDADIWDSKKISGNRSTEVEFGGDPLAGNSSFAWKVRIWDADDKPSEYSEIQTFATGDSDGYATTRNKFMTGFIKPAKIVKKGDTGYFIDFGKDAFGTLLLDYKAPSSDTLIIQLGEKLKASDLIDPEPGGSIRYHKLLLPVEAGRSTFALSLPADSRNTGASAIALPDSFGVVTPFRYCEIVNCKTSLRPEDIRQKAFRYFFDDSMSSFTCSDTVLNRVWDLCNYSIKATSFTGLYIDGDRERIPYEADAYINQLGHYYTDREYSMARLTDEYFISHPTWPTEWILLTISLFYNDLMYTGNTESLRQYYEELKNKTLVSIAREDGLISSENCSGDIMTSLGFSNPKEKLRDIVDWPPGQNATGWKLATPEGERDGYDMKSINTVVNAHYYHALVLMSELAGRLGKSVDSLFYCNQAARVKNSINEKLIDKVKGIYIDGEFSEHSSLHANMFSLAFGLVPENNRKAVLDFIKSRGMACSVYGSQFLLEGLYKAGEADYALALMTSTGDRSWYNMIRSGSTISMEAWDMKYKPNSDWNHAWGAAPANIIPGFMWGIAPVEPGYAKAIIKPQLGRLKYSKVSVPTIRGSISAEYRKKRNSGEFIVSIPANMECDFILPPVTEAVVTFNHKKYFPAPCYLKLEPGVNSIAIEKSQVK